MLLKSFSGTEGRSFCKSECAASYLTTSNLQILIITVWKQYWSLCTEFENIDKLKLYILPKKTDSHFLIELGVDAQFKAYNKKLDM